MDKKGVVGLETAKGVVIALLALGVLAAVAILVLFTMNTATENATFFRSYITNETTNNVNQTINLSVYGVRNCAATIYTAYNGTAEAVPINGNNYTVSGCVLTLIDNIYNNTKNWTLNYTYTYDQNYTYATAERTTNGLTQFFSYTPTFFILLAVVVLILIIAIVIIAVNRFAGGHILQQ
jgi:hypothetical protein